MSNTPPASSITFLKIILAARMGFRILFNVINCFKTTLFKLGEKNKSHGAGSDEYGGYGILMDIGGNRVGLGGG